MKKLVIGLYFIFAMFGYANDSEPQKVAGKSNYSISESVAGSISLQDTVSKIAQDLVMGYKKEVAAHKSVAITSFVDLHQLNKTTNFGRVVSESFYNELFKKDIEVVDFRMQNSLVVNANGEYFLSRDVKKLNKKVDAAYVLVGTYASVEEGVLINARIINSATGKIVGSSRGLYTDKSCEIFENCKAPAPHIVHVVPETHNTIKIITDNCSQEKCPKNCLSGNCRD